MGRRLQITWDESEAELKEHYLTEKQPDRRTRLQALWWRRQGQSMVAVSRLVGVNYRTVQDWAAWDRPGGRAEVLRHGRGYASLGRKAYLSAMQQKALAHRVASGAFRSVGEVIAWVKQRWGVAYTPDGMYDVLARYEAKLKGPRPRAAKANLKQQAEWKKGG